MSRYSFNNIESAVGHVTPSRHYVEPWGRDLDPYTNSRPSYTQENHDFWRPEDALPVRHADIMLQCNFAYESTGVVRNVIDLMSDFSCAGIKPVHPNASTERFYQKWFQSVRGPYITERMLSNFYRFATCIVRRNEATLTKSLKKGFTKADLDEFNVLPKRRSKRIPCGYRLENPTMIDILGGELVGLSNRDPQYGIKIPYYLLDKVRAPKNKYEEELVAKLPPELVQQIRDSKENMLDIFYPISSENLEVLHYKKDDWQTWAKPIVYSILQDIKLVNKMKLADFSVLDSAMDMLRIIKIGDLEHKIAPTQAACEKMSTALEANNPGGVRTIVWGPDVQMIESKLNGYDFLGEEKYRAPMEHIHSGMGIPATVTGADGGGATNNHISLKVLIERLCYGRELVRKFWNGEFERVRKALNHRYSAELQFDITNLEDEEAQQRIWIELADRNIISDEWIQEKVGAVPKAESSRVNREHNERNASRRTAKTSPYHDPQMDEKMVRSLVEQGRTSPRDIGVDVPDEGVPQPVSPIEEKELPKPNGRPPGTRDSEPRKRRKFKPRIKATQLWAKKAQKEVADYVNSFLLEKLGKKSVRSLTAEETALADKMKFDLFMGLQPGSALADGVGAPKVCWADYHDYVGSVEQESGDKLTLADKLEIQRELFVEEDFE